MSVSLGVGKTALSWREVSVLGESLSWGKGLFPGEGLYPMEVSVPGEDSILLNK